MIGIKGMELPKSCAECSFVTDDMLGDATCILLCDEWKDNENHRAENCPLVEDVVEREKIDKAIEEMERYSTSFEYANRHDLASAVDCCIGMIEKNIGESK